uniref:cytochrome c oxidase subunit III n=1 Tax=Barbatia decussata TaxID=1508519 RepID=UPI0020278376|nr:cytochrome c oxidase subunit III [Barbatia decussata]UQT66001.1 cytochrome c oxidase subunit 3 [Barbatia decussata]
MSYSPWPVLAGLSSFSLVGSAVAWFHGWGTVERCGLALVLLGIISASWWRDVIRESTFQGEHTQKEQKALWVGFVLFVCSEVMLFFSFFWAFFHSSLSPTVEIGCYWPPAGIKPISPWRAPLTMTAILVCSGMLANWSMHSVKSNNKGEALVSMLMTISLGWLFTTFQLLEYYESAFTFRDSVYGSVFFLITGFHGLHVIAGTIFLMVQCDRMRKYHFSTGHHLGLEFSVWYWHFVDVIWLFVVSLLYVWGGMIY